MKMKRNRHKLCPCHSEKRYKSCCQPYHEKGNAPTAEALMRSRYAAYALGLVDYIIDTTDPAGTKYKTPRAVWASELKDWCETTQFLGLEIMSSSKNMVTFKVNLVQKGKPSPYIERSVFTQPNGRWLYFDGVMV